jgi:hypothetical protein
MTILFIIRHGRDSAEAPAEMPRNSVFVLSGVGLASRGHGQELPPEHMLSCGAGWGMQDLVLPTASCTSGGTPAGQWGGRGDKAHARVRSHRPCFRAGLNTTSCPVHLKTVPPGCRSLSLNTTSSLNPRVVTEKSEFLPSSAE